MAAKIQNGHQLWKLKKPILNDYKGPHFSQIQTLQHASIFIKYNILLLKYFITMIY